MPAGLFALVAFFGVGVLVTSLLYGRVLSHLREVHEGTWRILGRPGVSPRSLVTNRGAMQRFLWRREFDELADPSLARKCEAFRWCLILFVFCMPVVVLVASAWPAA